MSPAGPLPVLTPAGLRGRCVVTLQNPTRTPDGDGGYTEAWTAVAPPSAVYARVQPVRAGREERTLEGTVAAAAGTLVTIPYHPAVTTQTRVLLGSRILAVIGLTNADEQGRQLTLTCTEVVP